MYTRMSFVNIYCSSNNKRTPVPKKRIKLAIKQAQLICPNFEDTIECKLAWEVVDELTIGYNKQEMVEKPDTLSEKAKREYDV